MKIECVHVCVTGSPCCTVKTKLNWGNNYKNNINKGSKEKNKINLSYKTMMIIMWITKDPVKSSVSFQNR